MRHFDKHRWLFRKQLYILSIEKKISETVEIASNGINLLLYAITASLPTQPTCIDHDARCSQYQQQICSSTVSKNYVISTCPKSCNKCAEYLG